MPAWAAGAGAESAAPTSTPTTPTSLNDSVDPMTNPRQSPAKLTARQQAILEFIRVNQPVTNKQIAQHFECSPSTAGVHLMHIAHAGLARSVGHAARACWLADRPFTEPKTPPPIAPPAIEQVSSIWHYAQRCARHARTA